MIVEEPQLRASSTEISLKLEEFDLNNNLTDCFQTIQFIVFKFSIFIY